MRVQPETLEALKASGLTYTVEPADLRALSRSFQRGRAKMGCLASNLLFLGAIVIFIAIARLHERFPDLLRWQLFLGILVGVVGLGLLAWMISWRVDRRRSADERVIGERVAGVDGETLWICKDDGWALFTSPHAFARVVFDEGYVFAYVSQGIAHIFREATLMRSAEGKAIHAWLARAKAEIEYGRAQPATSRQGAALPPSEA